MLKKPKPNLKRDTELLFELGTLRYVDRTWKQFLSPETANCSEHIFRVMWLALTLAKMEGKGNHEKILKIALAHDVPESRTGDVHYLSRQYTKRDELKAITDIFSGTVHEKEMTNLLTEYEKRDSLEAKIVKDADTLDVEIEMAELRAMGYSVGHVWKKSRRKFVYPLLFTASAKALWRTLEKTNPHDWHFLAEGNRYQSGDWKRGKK